MRWHKEKKNAQLVGIDVSIKKGGSPRFKEIAPFKCEFICYRGTKAWPGYVSQDLRMMKWDRCRFMGTKDIGVLNNKDFQGQIRQD